MITQSWLIYGTGAIAQKLAHELNRLGHQPIIAGCDEQAVLALAEAVNCQYRVFALDKPYALQQQLNDVAIVLDASDELASPFSHLIDACLKSSCHYIALQSWPNYPENAQALQAKAVELGLVLVFSTSFLPQALALWQGGAGQSIDYFVAQGDKDYLLPFAVRQHWQKETQGFVVADTPKLYWQVNKKTLFTVYANKACTWVFKCLKKTQPLTVTKVESSLSLSAFAQGQLLETIEFSPLQIQQFNQRSAIFILEAILASKILPGLYSAFEVVDNDPIQAQDFIAQIFLTKEPTSMNNALQTMLELQDRMNTKVHADWQQQNFAWFRAAWIECGELVDHHGYKWWKKQTPDMPQVQLEVVDIWHFGLSMLLDGRSYSDIASAIEAELNQGNLNTLPVIEATEALAGDLLARKEFSVVLFWQLLNACDMSFEQLFKQYVGKNVLNFFRQDHGYKDGSYTKVWQGKEDNEHLFEVLAELDTSAENVADVVYQQLQNRYPG